MPAPHHFLSLYPNLTSPDSRARRRVGCSGVGVGVDHDSGVALRSIAGDVGEVASTRRRASATSDNELGALSVELRRVGLVESEQLVTDQVVSWREGGRDRGFPVQVLHHVVVAPGGAGERGRGHALLVDLVVVRMRVYIFVCYDMRTLNQFLPEPLQALKAPEHLYIHTMTGPWACVHWLQMALTLPPAATGALRSAEVPPLHMTLLSVTVMVGL
jgi:hypothetical protein